LFGLPGQGIGGGVFLTSPGSTAVNTSIVNNFAPIDPNVHGTFAAAAVAASDAPPSVVPQSDDTTPPSYVRFAGS
jgi:hypothetical protein